MTKIEIVNQLGLTNKEAKYLSETSKSGISYYQRKTPKEIGKYFSPVHIKIRLEDEATNFKNVSNAIDKLLVMLKDSTYPQEVKDNTAKSMLGRLGLVEVKEENNENGFKAGSFVGDLEIFFEEWFEEQNSNANKKSKCTLNAYKNAKNHLVEFLENNKKKYKDINTFNYYNLLTDFQKYKMEKNFKTQSINTYVKNTRVFMKDLLLKQERTQEIQYLTTKGFTNLTNKEEEYEKVAVYTNTEEKQIEKFIEDGVLNLDKANHTDLVKYVGIKILKYTAVRVGGLCSINLDKVKYEKDNNGNIDYIRFEKVRLKGGKYYDIKISTKNIDIEIFKRYLEIVTLKQSHLKEKFLMVSGSGKKYSETNFWELVSNLGKVLGIDIYPHKFRHTLATKLINEKNWDIYKVSKLLAHSNVSITEKFYLHDEEKLRNNLFAEI